MVNLTTAVAALFGAGDGYFESTDSIIDQYLEVAIRRAEERAKRELRSLAKDLGSRETSTLQRRLKSRVNSLVSGAQIAVDRAAGRSGLAFVEGSSSGGILRTTHGYEGASISATDSSKFDLLNIQNARWVGVVPPKSSVSPPLVTARIWATGGSPSIERWLRLSERQAELRGRMGAARIELTRSADLALYTFMRIDRAPIADRAIEELKAGRGVRVPRGLQRRTRARLTGQRADTGRRGRR